jgi:site-specific recombinase XerD
MQTQKQDFIRNLQKNGRASATILAYAKDLDQLIEYLTKNNVAVATDITAEHLDGFKAELTSNHYTLKSISRKLNSIKSFFKYLVGQGVMVTSPANGVTHP